MHRSWQVQRCKCAADMRGRGLVLLQRLAAMASPRLPTGPIQWRAECPSKVDLLLPHSGPISGYRQRPHSQTSVLWVPSDSHSSGAHTDGHALDQEAQNQGTVPAKLPSCSLLQLHLPLSNSPALLQRYVQPDQHYNLPLLVEDLDTFAADAASRHVGPTQNKLVTAYCESIVWLHHQYPASPTTLQQKQKAGGNSTPPAEPHQVYYLPKAGSEECQGPGVPAGDSSRASSTLPAVQRTSRVQPGDLLLTSQVEWVGRSSMSVLVEASVAQSAPPAVTEPANYDTIPTGQQPTQPPGCSLQHSSPSSLSSAEDVHNIMPEARNGASGVNGCAGDGSSWRTLVGRARFVMASRDYTMTKSAPVPGLLVGNPNDAQLAAEAQVRQNGHRSRREQDAGTSLSSSEVESLRDLVARHEHLKHHQHHNQHHHHNHQQQESLPDQQARQQYQKPGQHLQDGPLWHPQSPTRSSQAGRSSQGGDTAPGQHTDNHRQLTASCIGSAGGPGHEVTSAQEQQHVYSHAPAHLAALIHKLVQEHGEGAQQGGSVEPPSSSPGGAVEGGGEGWVTCKSTELSRVFTTKFEDRNTTGTIFGGQLLRYGVEMAEEVARAHAQRPVHMIACQDVPFLALVPIGVQLHLRGHVVYTCGSLMSVYVYAGIEKQPAETSSSASGEAGHSPQHHQRDLIHTHSFWCTFATTDGRAVLDVLPNSLRDVRAWMRAQQLLATLEHVRQ